MEPIAVIRLRPGQGGFYDELSRIHLTVGSPEATVYAGTNCSQLRRSVRSGRLALISGSLGTEEKPKPITKANEFSAGNFIPETKAKKVSEETVSKKETVAEPVKKESPKEEKKTEPVKAETKTVKKEVKTAPASTAKSTPKK